MNNEVKIVTEGMLWAIACAPNEMSSQDVGVQAIKLLPDTQGHEWGILTAPTFCDCANKLNHQHWILMIWFD